MNLEAAIEQEENLTLNQYQQAAIKTAVYRNSVDKIIQRKDVNELLKLLYSVSGLSGEAGELSNKVKKIIRDNEGIIDKETRHRLMLELGDVLWYVSDVASLLNFALSDVASVNLFRLYGRKREGKLKGEGDER